MLAMPGVLRREAVGKHRQFADGFERRLAGGGLAEDAAVGSLAVQRETRAVTLRAEELERAVAARLGGYSDSDTGTR